MLGLGLGVRIETLIRGFFLEGILSGGDFIRWDFVLDSIGSAVETTSAVDGLL